VRRKRFDIFLKDSNMALLLTGVSLLNKEKEQKTPYEL